MTTESVDEPGKSLIASLITPEVIADTVKQMIAGVTATRYDKVMGECADWPTRFRFVELCLAYAEGEPIKRQQYHSIQHITVQELERRTQESPALRDSLKHLLDKLPSANVVDLSAPPPPPREGKSKGGRPRKTDEEKAISALERAKKKAEDLLKAKEASENNK